MSAFDDLKKRLEGKTIAKIELPHAPEAIAKFVTTDGMAFILHATELGYWMRDVAATPDDAYPSLTSLMEQYHSQVYYPSMRTRNFEGEPPPAVVILVNDRLTLTSPDKAVSLFVRRSSLSEYEQRIALSDAGRKLLGEAANLGDAWGCLFNAHNEDCPRDLVHP